MYLKANSPHAATAGKSVIGFNIINGKEVEGDLSLIQSKSAGDHRDLVGMFPDSGEKDVARAAKAAADTFGAWSRSPLAQRQAVAKQTAAILTAHQEKIARIVTREVGMTHREALAEVQEAIEACIFFAAESDGAPKRDSAKGSAAKGSTAKGPQVRRRPVGVCGILATGTSPLAAPARKILPAILSGNTVVWKPSDNAPTAAYLFLLALMEAGLPHGVVNTVNGRGRAGCGKHFLAGIDKGLFQSFSFVGSADLGRHVGEVCGRNLILPNLEVVGKGFLVVLPDADLKRAAADAALAAFRHGGQSPVVVGNILVHQDCAAAFKKAFLAQVASLPVGNPLSDPDVAYGPMLNARAATAFREHWEHGRTEGATLLTGGEQWHESHRSDQVKGNVGHGVYMQPCVWEGVTPDMRLFQHRTLGPTVNLVTFSDFDQAMGWLGAAPGSPLQCLYTKDSAAIQRFQRESPAELTLVNAAAVAPGLSLPLSGQGTRPGARSALEAFTRWQATNQAPVDEALPVAEPPAASIRTDWASL